MTSDYRPTSASVEVLYEDVDILVCVKPAPLLTVPGRGPEKRLRRVSFVPPGAQICALPTVWIKIHQVWFYLAPAHRATAPYR